MALRILGALMAAFSIAAAMGALLSFVVLALGVRGSGPNDDLEVATNVLKVASVLLVPSFLLSCRVVVRPEREPLLAATALLAPAVIFEGWLAVMLH